MSYPSSFPFFDLFPEAVCICPLQKLSVRGNVLPFNLKVAFDKFAYACLGFLVAVFVIRHV